MVLDRIQGPNDVHKLDAFEREKLAREIRSFLIEKLSVTGGHLASNLGVVELTIALHSICDLPRDQIVWDVGHQSYTHKILTGRKGDFDRLRTMGGLAGFPKREESDCDIFGTGHSSTSISAGLGLAVARELKGEDYKIFSVIGDGAMTGGMVYEALNNAAEFKKNFVIILNDNNMSISRNVGGLSMNLARMRTSENYKNFKSGMQSSLEKIPVYGNRIVDRMRKTKEGIKQLVIPGMMFEQMGIMYLGPIDGNDIEGMRQIFLEATKIEGPVIVHVLTTKGRGFAPAERHPAKFHGTAPYDMATGLPLKNPATTYTDVFSTVMRKMGGRNDRLLALTAAMETGTGLVRFHNRYPGRFFDVGIAEQHAVTFAAGLASQGLIPVFAVYSSFLQRAFDQILHDVAIQKLHVIFAIDRAGLVGPDGETHQGIFDLSYLSLIPNMVILAPKNKWELSDMLKWAIDTEGPVAIRYPRGAAFDGLREFREPIQRGRAEEIYPLRGRGTKMILLAPIGSMVERALCLRELLLQAGYDVALVNMRFAKPVDEAILADYANRVDLIVPMEENVLAGGFGEHVETCLKKIGYRGRTFLVGFADHFIPHGSVEALMEEEGLTAEKISQKIISLLSSEE